MHPAQRGSLTIMRYMNSLTYLLTHTNDLLMAGSTLHHDTGSYSSTNENHPTNKLNTDSQNYNSSLKL